MQRHHEALAAAREHAAVPNGGWKPEPETGETTVSIQDYLARRWEEVLQLTIEHVLAVALSVILATAIGLILGSLVYRNEKATSVLLNSSSTLFTIPALSYFGFMVPLIGLGWLSTIIVLTIYATLPIVRNTVTGLQEVDPAIVKSAVGMGMNRFERLWRIEMPLAWPVIITGIRVATVMTVGIAAIAAYVAGPGLGAEIFGGLSAIGSTRAVAQAMTGTVAVIVVALGLDGLLLGVSRLTTSKGLR
ncbi:MAG: ABC transporter permease [Egibacteraceae bacterium]